MRRIWVFLMLCTAASAWAQCATTATGPAPHRAATHATHATHAASSTHAQMAKLDARPQDTSALRVSAVQAAAPPQPARGEPAPASPSHPWGAPLLISALVMLVIALRRGSR